MYTYLCHRAIAVNLLLLDVLVVSPVSCNNYLRHVKEHFLRRCFKPHSVAC